MKKLLLLLILAACVLSHAAFAQTTTTITGTVKDLSNAAVTSGQVSFTLQPGIDTAMSGTARFTPSEIDCTITGVGAVKALDGVSTCTVVNNTALQPSGTSYRVCIQPQFIQPGSCFVWYATGGSVDITQQVPTPPLTPAYNLVDLFSNQTVAGNKTFSGNVIFSSGLTFGNFTASGTLTANNGGSLGGSFTGNPVFAGNPAFNGNPTLSGNVSVGGTLGAKHIDTLSDCSNSAFANTAACQTDASTTGGMFFPPNYSIGAFTNSSNRPVLDITKVDWRGFVSVKDFGAKGDGATDDTTAIQAAINFVCTGSSTTAPTANLCPNAISGNAVGGTVYIPAGDYHYSSPILVYGGITLRGAGKLATKLTKTTNTVGSGSITAGTGVGRSPTSCSGGPCVDSFAVDSLISVPYISSGNTDYAYRWTIRDMALYGSGTNGTKYGIYAPRASQSVMKDLYIFMNCSQGAPANCGSVQGNGFFTEDSWLMRHEGITVDSVWIGWNHVNDGSSLGSGTSTIFGDDWGVNIGCSGFHLFGLSYSNMNANAIDHFNKKGTDLVASDGTCYPYSFNSTSGMSINGGGAEDVIGGIMWANASSITISGGFKTFTQVGQTSGATLATIFIDGGSAVTMNGTLFSAVTSPGNIFNIVLQNSSFLNDTNSTLPTGGNGFIGYSGTSAKCDFNAGVLTCTNSANSSSFSAAGANFGSAPATTGLKVPTAAGAAPTANGQVAYDSTSNQYEGGVNGTKFPFTQTIASGTAAMTTAGITTGACGTTVTVAGTGILTTDTIDISHNAAVTIGNGGGLTLNAWPTAGNVNFNYCNSAAGTITPTAMTINWSVRRP